MKNERLDNMQEENNGFIMEMFKIVSCMGLGFFLGMIFTIIIMIK